MSDLISRQAAIAHAISGRTRELDGEKWIRISEVRESLQTMPSAGPERKKGKWKVWNIQDYAQRPTGRKVGECPFCGYLTSEFRWLFESSHKLTNFCPNCGASMDEERKENDE